ncbi:MAG TPA: hypothetical protein VNH38_02600 [Candidatus Dormibacteraeota bacterium]|nr:hypothetical protein [Candidatus Dormibacteraeota bacterium]
MTKVNVLVLHGVGVLLAVLLWLAATVMGILAYIRVVVASSVVVLESADPWLAIRRSWWLSRGSGWRIFGTLLVLSILAAVLAVMGAIAVAAVAQVGGGSSHPVGDVILLVGRIAVLVLITPIVSASLVLLYFDLRARREGPSPIPLEAQPSLQS